MKFKIVSENCDWFIQFWRLQVFVWKPDYRHDFGLKAAWGLTDGDGEPAIVTPWFTAYWWEG